MNKKSDHNSKFPKSKAKLLPKEILRRKKNCYKEINRICIFLQQFRKKLESSSKISKIYFFNVSSQ